MASLAVLTSLEMCNVLDVNKSVAIGHRRIWYLRRVAHLFVLPSVNL